MTKTSKKTAGRPCLLFENKKTTVQVSFSNKLLKYLKIQDVKSLLKLHANEILKKYENNE